MKDIKMYYGSSTGTTQEIAGRIAEKLNLAKDCIKDVSNLTKEDAEKADVLLLGSSTWGSGDLQDDWYSGIDILKTANLDGKVIALFGCGDSQSFGDTFCGALGSIYNALKDSGATFVGFMPTDGYDYSDSEAIVNGQFVGLAIDEANEPEKTDERIDLWVSELKPHL
jgi:flavodoxin I